MSDDAKYTKTIICLANSRRPSGHCFAGREFKSGKIGPWVRPVNAENDNAISDLDRQYSDGKYASVLDVVTIPLVDAKPDAHQTENERIDPKQYWTKQGVASWEQVVSATEKIKGPLWVNGDHSFHGMNDKVSAAAATAAGLANSLMLIEPQNLRLVVGNESQYMGGYRRRVRATFKADGVPYNFVVTDPWIEEIYFAKPDGSYPIPESRIAVSLSEIINGSSTKLVAAVITPERAGKSG